MFLILYRNYKYCYKLMEIKMNGMQIPYFKFLAFENTTYNATPQNQ